MITPPTFDKNYPLCIVLGSINIFVNVVQINLIIALSVDRYWAVCHPVSYFQWRNSNHKTWIILGSVFLGALIGTIPLIEWHEKVFEICFPENIFSPRFLNFCSVFMVFSCTIIVTIYTLIYKSISAHVSS